MRWLKFLITVILLMTGCSNENITDTEIYIEETTEGETTSYIDSLVSSMTLEEMVYQMMFVTPEALTGEKIHTSAGDSMKEALSKCPVGGIVYFADNLVNYEQTALMIANTKAFSQIPLFISVDEEGGRVSRLGKNKQMGVTYLPPMSEVKDKNEAFSMANKLGEEIKALGFNMDFAPVCDILINKNNTEIGNRSFGCDAQDVGEKVSGFVKGLKKAGVISVLKHFPGHGSTILNSHTGYSESERYYEELKNEEFVAFKKGIRAGSEFVMVSHMTLVNATEEKVPSSLSKEVITVFLREELGFEGVVITDSFSMGAITKEYSGEDAAVMAVKAGADMILMPKDVKKAAEAIVEAVECGEIEKSTIETSVKRIISAKKNAGIMS